MIISQFIYVRHNFAIRRAPGYAKFFRPHGSEKGVLMTLSSASASASKIFIRKSWSLRAAARSWCFRPSSSSNLSGAQNSTKEGKSAINLSNLGKFLPNLAPGHLVMLGRLAVPTNIYVRPVGSPENTSNIGENPNINNLT